MAFIAQSQAALFSDVLTSDLIKGKSWIEESFLFEIEQYVQLQEALKTTYRYLDHFFQSHDLYETLQTAFGTDFDIAEVIALQRSWTEGHQRALPDFRILDESLGSANGGYSQQTNTIYLFRQFVERNESEAIAATLIEEYGHFIDAKINSTDTRGDEGNLFATLVQNKALSVAEQQQIAAEDDTTTIEVDGQTIVIEQAEERPPFIDDDVVTRVEATVNWKDGDGNLHLARGVKVEIWKSNWGPDTKLATPRTTSQGTLSQLVMGLRPTDKVYLKVFSEGATYATKNPLVAGPDVYYFESDAQAAGETFTVNIENSIPPLWTQRVQQAFSVNDAMYVANQFYNDFLSNLLSTTDERPPSGPLPENIYAAPNWWVYDPYFSSYNSELDSLHVKKDHGFDWDVALHEYGHFLSFKNAWADADQIAETYEGGQHNRGISNTIGSADGNIPSRPKEVGDRIAWSEGLSDYISLSIQDYANLNNLLPNNLAHTGDFEMKVDDNIFTIETSTDGISPEGESDELATSRILWDLADDHVDTFRSGLSDTYSLTHAGLYTLLDAFPDQSDGGSNTLNRLHDIWGALSTSASNREKAEVGAIFEEYSVAPFVEEDLYTEYDPESTNIPTFNWTPGNEVRRGGQLVAANDIFQVAIYNHDFSELKLNSSPLRQLHWTPDENEWGTLSKNELYNFVVIGSDDKKGFNGSTTYNNSVSSIGYWSGARSFSIGEVENAINITKLKQGVSAFNDIHTVLQQADLFTDVPIIGSLEDAEGALGFVDNFQSALIEEIQGLNNYVTADELEDAFRDSLLTAGVETADEDIKIVEETDGSTRFDFQVSGDFSLLSQSLAADLGLPGLGLSLTTSGELDLSLGMAFNFSLDIDEDGSVALTTPGTEDLSFNLRAAIPDGQLTGNLGFLQVDVEKDNSLPSALSFDLDIDLENAGIADIDIGGAASLNLDLETSFSGSQTLPSLLSDFDLDWDFDNSGAPRVAFNNVRVDTGSFLSRFASPVLSKVRSITQPMEPFLDVLNAEVNLGPIEIGMRDVAGIRDNSSEDKFLNSLTDVVSLINNLPSNPNNNIEIQLGSFDLGSADVRSETLDLSQVNPQNINLAASLSQQVAGQSFDGKSFFTRLVNDDSGLAFPLIENPTEAFDLLLGKDVDLFSYDLPEISIGAQYGKFIPIFGPLGAKINGTLSASADLGFGFDTYGLRQATQPNDSRVFNGFYVDADSELGLNAGLEASAEVNAGIASAGAGGGITGELSFQLNDRNRDGDVSKVHLDDIDLANPFHRSGQIKAGLFAYFKVGWGWFSYTKRFRGPETVLASFGSSNRLAPVSVIEIPADETLGTPVAYEYTGNSDNNQIDGSARTDFMVGSGGADVLSGEDGFDVASYFTSDKGITLDLKTGYKTGDAAGDTFESIEQYEGSNWDDILRGSDQDDILDGLAGNDTLEGRNGNDVFIGSEGADTIKGDAGIDSLTYIASDAGVRVDLSSGAVSGGIAQGDHIYSIENIEGSVHNDTLIGNSGNNVLSGDEGNDILEGGVGLDTLIGGGGRDRFDIRGGGIDTINDFDSGRDTLWIRDANIELFSDLSIVQIGQDTLIKLRIGQTTLARLKGVQAGMIGEEVFANDFLSEPRNPNPPVPGKPGRPLL